jgi:hypothetical protein
LGNHLDLPELAPFIKHLSFNMGGRESDESYTASMLGGCYEKSSLVSTTDDVPDVIQEQIPSELISTH